MYILPLCMLLLLLQSVRISTPFNKSALLPFLLYHIQFNNYMDFMRYNYYNVVTVWGACAPQRVSYLLPQHAQPENLPTLLRLIQQSA